MKENNMDKFKIQKLLILMLTLSFGCAQKYNTLAPVSALIGDNSIGVGFIYLEIFDKDNALEVSKIFYYTHEDKGYNALILLFYDHNDKSIPSLDPSIRKPIYNETAVHINYRHKMIVSFADEFNFQYFMDEMIL